MPVYGAQLFLWPPEIINIHVDRNETPANMPDIILVNGPYYKHENIDIPCKVGPSMRYARLFGTSIAPTHNKKTLVVLSQFQAEARFTVELAVEAERQEDLMFKPHPTLQNASKREMPFPAGSLIVKGNLYDLFYKSSLVIGSSSGSLVEAAVVGIPVIICNEKDVANYTYMPDIGRGLLWESASNVEELKEAKSKLFAAVTYRNGERLAAIDALRSALFNCPTNKAVVECLDLRT